MNRRGAVLGECGPVDLRAVALMPGEVVGGKLSVFPYHGSVAAALAELPYFGCGVRSTS